MGAFSVGPTQSTNQGYGFVVTGAHGRPVVTFEYETKEQAEAARKHVMAAIEHMIAATPAPSR